MIFFFPISLAFYCCEWEFWGMGVCVCLKKLLSMNLLSAQLTKGLQNCKENEI